MTGKSDYLQILSAGFGRLAGWMADHRFIVIGMAVLVTAGMFTLAAGVRTDNSFDTFFDDNDPTYQFYIEYQEDFGSDEVAYILYEAPGNQNGVYDLEVMRQVDSLTEALESEVPFVSQATSLTNVEFIQVDGDFLEIQEIRLDFPEDQDSMLERRSGMLKKPIYYNNLFNEDASFGAIVLEMTLASTSAVEEMKLDPDGGEDLTNLYPQVSQVAIEDILNREEYAGLKFYQTGDVPMNSAYNNIIIQDLGVLTLASLVLVAIISMLFFGFRLIGLVGPLLVVLMGLVFTLGFMGIFGFDIGLLFLIVPTLLIALGVAQSVHLISEFDALRRAGMERREAIKLTLNTVGVSCMLASITTAVGFLAMAGSKLAGLSNLAILMAAGIFFVFVLTITLMVSFMAFDRDRKIDTNAAPRVPIVDKALQGVTHIVLNYRYSLLVLSAVLFAVCLVGASKLVIAFNFIDEFKDEVTFKSDTLKVEEVMGGSLNLVYLFDTGVSDGAKTNDVLKVVQKVQAKADEHPLVTKTYSLVDVLKDVNQSFNADDPEFYTLPEDNDLIAQYLLMYELSGGEELGDFIAGDYSKTVLEIRIKMADSNEVTGLMNELDTYAAQLTSETVQIQTSGTGKLWTQMAVYIADSQIQGYFLAFLMIAVILVLAYKSISVGLLAMIPNLAPIIATLGFMGWTGIHLDYFRLLLATIAIGIAVDDTVHFATRLRREFYKTGNYVDAVRASIQHVGRALVITTVILTVAFSSFLASQMAVLASFGILLASTIVMALIADIFLLPALVLVFKPFGPQVSEPQFSNLKPV